MNVCTSLLLYTRRLSLLQNSRHLQQEAAWDDNLRLCPREHMELDIQIAQLKMAGCQLILFEKESGAKDDRNQLSRLFRRLRKGDTVLFPALD